MTHRLTMDLRRLRRDSHDYCSVCGRSFEEGETTHSGYDELDHPLYVGDCCVHLVAETAVRNVYNPLPYERPPGGSSLWRYMHLAKFIALLKDQALFFARADKLGDPFEGAKGFRRRKEDWDEHYLNFFREAVRTSPSGHASEMTDEQLNRTARRLLRELEEGGKQELLTTFLSCWHENEHESEALWKIYGGDEGNAIAVRSTYTRLNDALGDDPSIKIGRVKYLDFRKSFAGVNDAFFRKRKAFQHEREVRAVVRVYDDPPENGVNISADIETLVHSLYVSPLAPPWYSEVVKEVVRRFDLDLEVVTSSLLEDPFH